MLTAPCHEGDEQVVCTRRNHPQDSHIHARRHDKPKSHWMRVFKSVLEIFFTALLAQPLSQIINKFSTFYETNMFITA
jgi:hypothetical protein